MPHPLLTDEDEGRFADELREALSAPIDMSDALQRLVDDLRQYIEERAA